MLKCNNFIKLCSQNVYFFILILCIISITACSSDKPYGPNILGLQLGMSREDAVKSADKLLAKVDDKMKGQMKDEDFKKKDNVLFSDGIILVFDEKKDRLKGFVIREKVIENNPELIKWTRPTKEEMQNYIKEISKEADLSLSDWEKTIYGYVYKKNGIVISIDPYLSSNDAGISCGVKE